MVVGGFQLLVEPKVEPVWWNCDRVAGGGLDFASSFTSWLVRSIAIQSFNELQCVFGIPAQSASGDET